MSHSKWKDIEIDPLQEYNAESHRVTIESIQLAMNELLKTKDFRQITIQDLAKKAGVSRSAFYRNYSSKEEVLQSIVHDAFFRLAKEIQADITSPTDDAMLRTLQSVIEQCRDMHSILQAGAWQGDTLLQCMNLYFSDFISAGLPIGDEMQMRFWMGGVYNAIQYWLDTGMKETPAELAQRLLSYMAKE